MRETDLIYRINESRDILIKNIPWGSKQYVDMVYDTIIKIVRKLNLKEENKIVQYYINPKTILMNINKKYNKDLQKWALAQLKGAQRFSIKINTPKQNQSILDDIKKIETDQKKDRWNKDKDETYQKPERPPVNEENGKYLNDEGLNRFFWLCFNNREWDEIYSMIKIVRDKGIYTNDLETLKDILPWEHMQRETPGGLFHILSIWGLDKFDKQKVIAPIFKSYVDSFKYIDKKKWVEILKKMMAPFKIGWTGNEPEAKLFFKNKYLYPLTDYYIRGDLFPQFGNPGALIKYGALDLLVKVYNVKFILNQSEPYHRRHNMEDYEKLIVKDRSLWTKYKNMMSYFLKDEPHYPDNHEKGTWLKEAKKYWAKLEKGNNQENNK